MRLAITRMATNQAEIVCVDSRSAKKYLRENKVSLLAIDYFLAGRENGAEILSWAKRHSVLPNHVVITERDRTSRLSLARELRSAGYRTIDDITFIRH